MPIYIISACCTRWFFSHNSSVDLLPAVNPWIVIVTPTLLFSSINSYLHLCHTNPILESFADFPYCSCMLVCVWTGLPLLNVAVSLSQSVLAEEAGCWYCRQHLPCMHPLPMSNECLLAIISNLLCGLASVNSVVWKILLMLSCRNINMVICIWFMSKSNVNFSRIFKGSFWQSYCIVLKNVWYQICTVQILW